MGKDVEISVLMPVYNCELYIREAVESILNQTYANFEFLILDDASIDGTVEIIKSFRDDRIKLIEKPKNTGLTNSLNLGLKLAKGKYIARMDGDDISLPERFEKQLNFMEANPDVVVCGSQYQIIGTNKICNHPSNHETIKVKLITGCYIAHPTVMIRREFVVYNNIQYDTKMEPAEDYDLWSKLVFMGKLANLNEVLLHYRIHQNQTSSLRNVRQKEIANTIKLRMLQKLITSLTLDDLSIDRVILFLHNQNVYNVIKNRIQLFNKLEAENKIKKIYKTDVFKDFIKDEKKHLAEVFYTNKKEISLKNYLLLFFNEISFFKILGIKRSLALFLKK